MSAQSNGRGPRGTAPARRTGTRYPSSSVPFRGSVVVDVDIDLVGNVDVRRFAAEPEFAAEHIKQDKDDNDQQHDGEHAAASAATRFHNGRTVGAVIIGHGNSPSVSLL